MGSGAPLLLWSPNGKIPFSPYLLADRTKHSRALNEGVVSCSNECPIVVCSVSILARKSMLPNFQNPFGSHTLSRTSPSNLQTLYFSNNSLFTPDSQLVLLLAPRALQPLTCIYGKAANTAPWKSDWPALCGSYIWFSSEQRIKFHSLLLQPLSTMIEQNRYVNICYKSISKILKHSDSFEITDETNLYY